MNQVRALAIITSLISCLVSSQAIGSQYHIYGGGMGSCGAYTEARRTHSSLEGEYIEWVEGYLTAIDASAFDLKKTDVEGVTAWLDKYCRSHPLDTVNDASEKLANELKEKK